MKALMAGRSFRSARRGAALFVCAAIISACAPANPPIVPLVRIRVGEAPHEVPLGTTFGDVIRQLALRPHDGRLLSVSGAMILGLELDRPFDGILRIPADPILRALAKMAQ